MAPSKEQLRRAARRMRDAIPGPDADRAAEAAARHLLALPALAGARTVSLYAAAHGELDPERAGAELAARGVTLVYPRVSDRTRLTFHTGELLASRFGLREPAADSPEVSLDQIDVMVIPGLAFDSTGTRLGWGKGYYDRALAASRAVRVGYCFALQVVPHVPREPYDIPMHHLVTEDGALSPP